MKIEFNTSKYTWEYGKAPKGRGWWFFTFEGYDFSTSGTYADAKKACKDYIKEIAPSDYVGTVYVTVEI